MAKKMAKAEWPGFKGAAYKLRKGKKLVVRLSTATGSRQFDPPLTHHRWVTMDITDPDTNLLLLSIELPLLEFGQFVAQQEATAWVDWAPTPKEDK